MPSQIAIDSAIVRSDSARRGRVELGDQAVEGVFEVRLVLIRMRANKVDDLPITLDGALVITARRIDHAEPVVAIVHFGIAHKQIACGSFGFIESAGVHHIDDGVGGIGQLAVRIEFPGLFGERLFCGLLPSLPGELLGL